MILVTGATGFLGKNTTSLLAKSNTTFTGTSLSSGLDLRNSSDVNDYFNETKPQYVINCAAYVGGIQFGLSHEAEIFYNNMLMTINILEACRKFNVKRLVNPISNCAYPAKASLFKEEEFWEGALHSSVLVYGMARKMSLVGSHAYANQFSLDSINLVLSNMYGPQDHFDVERSHALGALIKKIVDAKRFNIPEVVIWGTGKPVREWLYVEDAAVALIKALKIDKYSGPINVGVGKGCSIMELAELIKKKVSYNGELRLDTSKIDGARYKTVDGSLGQKLLNWTPQTTLDDGIQQTLDWYYKNV